MATKVGVKANGTLKKGYKYKKGGGVVKAKITTLKKKAAPKKKVAPKKTVYINKGNAEFVGKKGKLVRRYQLGSVIVKVGPKNVVIAKGDYSYTKKAAPKKKVAKKKTVNKGSLKASLLSAGVRLPHGYAIVKRAVKKRTVKMK